MLVATADLQDSTRALALASAVGHVLKPFSAGRVLLAVGAAPAKEGTACS